MRINPDQFAYAPLTISLQRKV